MDRPANRQIGETRSSTLRRYAAAAVVLLVGVALSVALFVVVHNSQWRRIQTDFERAAEDRVSAVKREIESHLLIVESLGSFVASSRELQEGDIRRFRGQFRAFVPPLLSRRRSIQALKLVPRVLHRQREAYEAGVREAGHPGFQITERQTQGKMVRAARREEYFPVHFVEPLKGNEIALGFDLASDPTRLEALNRSRDTGRMLATARITLVQETGEQFGFLVFVPVYRKGAPADTIRDRRENLEGFGLGVFRIGDIVENALSYVKPEGIDMRLLDSSADSGKQFLHSHSSRMRGSPAAQNSGMVAALQAAMRYRETFDVAGRRWTIVCTPTGEFLSSATTWQIWGSLAGGLLLTGTLVFYLVSTITHATRIAKANQQLSDEIVQRRRAEHELSKAKDAAEEANRAKSDFLAKMSHEIRTPMTAILGYADLLTDPALSPSDRDNHVAVIRRNGERLLGLINQILDLSKIEAGKMTVEMRRCGLVSVVADVAGTMGPRAEQRGTCLSVEYAGELPETILTDAARLRQAMINLVGNAVKFTENGSVRIVVTFLPDWREGLPAVRMQVIDTGIGISKEKLPHLFDPFMQADASTSRRYGGTGLGLAITHYIAELLGGQLTVQSAPGTGSTFTMTIPTGSLEGVNMLDRPAEAARAPAPGPQAPGPRTLAGIRVLLAEDGIDNQRLIQAVLSRAGASVEIAENGRVAVSKADAETFDVILMDMQMPEMDGYQATGILRNRGCDAPILALTAHAMSVDRQRCLAAGCDDHLAKPIDHVRLIEAVAEHAGRRAAGENGAADSARTDAGEARQAIEPELADDPHLAGLIDEFVAGLADRVGAIRGALAHGDLARVQRLSHQLRGAAGSYGYAALTDLARRVEQAAKGGDTEGARLALKELADLAQAVIRARRPRGRLDQQLHGRPQEEG